MISEEPLVSILMNCYNGERYLRDSLDSIINQSYENWELIFWDNQSKDQSKDIFFEYSDDRFKYFYAPVHTDLGNARASAYKHLSGDFIAFLDTDDLWAPDKLKEQLKLFSDPEVGIVISDTIFFDNSSQRVLFNKNYPPEGYVFKNLLNNYFVSLETLILRKSTVEKLEYSFDPEFSFIADFDLVIRAARISKLAICKKVLAKWRVHEDSDSWKSMISFPLEKERWIEKQILLDKKFFLANKKSFSIFRNRNYLIMSIYYLALNKRLLGIKSLLQGNLLDLKIIFVFIMCLLPFSNYLIKFLLKVRMKRLLG